MTSLRLRPTLAALGAGAVILLLFVRTWRGTAGAGFDAAVGMWIATLVQAIAVSLIGWWIARSGWAGARKGALLVLGLLVLLFAAVIVAIGSSDRPWNH